MIRRREDSTGSFALIAQHDHALLSGKLAEQLDFRLLARPEPYEPVMLGIALHDSGWPLHDEHPTLDARGLPLDVFETPSEIGLKVWTASADRAAEVHPYAGLLVSLHVLSLSQLLASQPTSPRDNFEINKFHHREIERQETLRRALGLRTDLPSKLGLAAKHVDAREDALRFHFHLLQAMDRVSLALCCTNEPFNRIAKLPFAPGGEDRSIAFDDGPAGALSLDPWLFDADELREQVPFRRIAARSYADDEDLRAAFAAAPLETLTFTLSRSQDRS